MRQRIRGTLVLAAVLASSAAPRAQRATTPPAPTGGPTPVEIHTALSRTAAWVGDQVIYTIELRTLPAFDIVLDDLSQERLRVEGGEVVAAESAYGESGRRAVRRVRYTVLLNGTNVTALRIPALVVRYYERSGDGAAGRAPSGEVIVPSAAVAVRSTLPDGGTVTGPRIPGDLRGAPRWLGLARPVGLGFIVLTIVPVLLWILQAGPHARSAWARFLAAQERRRRRTAFAEVQALAPSSDADRVAAFQQLDAFVRGHLEGHAGVPALALTPGEMRLALEGRGGAFAPEAAERLLAACERARYAPDPPSAGDWSDAVRGAEDILRHGPR